MNARLIGALLALMVAGCASYVTPGAGVRVGDLSKFDTDIAKADTNVAKVDTDIAEVLKREPTASFPAHIVIARIESPGYYTRRAQCVGRGRMCVVTTHEIETDKDFDRIASLPMVADAAPIGRLLLPEQIDSVRDLRLGAARLKADMLLVYSIDTRFHVEAGDLAPLELVSLGFFPNRKARVTATASAALFDVRTGFVYGVAESSATEEQRTTIWASEDVIDHARLRAEGAAFQGLLSEYEKLWQRLVRKQAPTG
jgi:hypothetical protein